MLGATTRSFTAAALAVFSLVVGCSSASTSIPAPVPLTSTTLIARLGTDTVAIERYTRTTKKMEGLIVMRIPAARIGRYSVQLGPNGAPTRADFSLRDGDGSTPAGGMQSLGRVRVFGQTSMGQALPALFDKLPNGDVFIHAWGDFVTGTGVRIEGRGVIPESPIVRWPLSHEREGEAVVGSTPGTPRPSRAPDPGPSPELRNESI